MREIHCEQIRAAVRELVLKANVELLRCCGSLKGCATSRKNPPWPAAFWVYYSLMPKWPWKRKYICQDTGMVSVHIDMGQEVRVVGGDINQAVVRASASYQEGYFRKSVVNDPAVSTAGTIPRHHSLPAFPGDHFNITVGAQRPAAKTWGSSPCSNRPGPGRVRDFAQRRLKRPGQCLPAIDRGRGIAAIWKWQPT